MPEPLARGEEKPPSRRMKRYWKIAVLANIKDDTHPKPEASRRMLSRTSITSRQSTRCAPPLKLMATKQSLSRPTRNYPLRSRRQSPIFVSTLQKDSEVMLVKHKSPPYWKC